MASKKIEIDIIVNGKMQKATVSAKKLQKALDGVDNGQKKTGKSAGELDRNMKGAAQATSNTTKEFAKMSQGMGGLVAVYAQIAAATFALSAAFQFMKDSMEIRNLMEGQKAFGAVTGVAYQSLTADIRAATDGMLSFRDAAQAAAIGTAAGLSRGQLEQLGTAAKNTSFALGRDLTDSFNRLVRGVTKAEPELLDELGIILRLDPALKAYSVAIGKNVKDLNQFEKSQAIANEVLTQAEQKFGAIAKIMDPNAAALAQFQQSFTDLMDGFKAGLADTLIPVFNFLKDNTASLIGALSLVGLPILKNILPNFEAMGEAAREAYTEASNAAKAASQDARTFAQTGALAGGNAAGRASVMSASQARGAGLGIKTLGKGSHEGMLSKRQLTIYKKQLADKELMNKKFNKKQLMEFRRFLAEQEALHATSEGKKLNVTQRAEMRKRTLYAQTAAAYKGAQALMVAATEKAAKGMNAAMKLAGFLGIALLVFDIGRMLKDWLFPMSEAEKKAKKFKEEIKAATEAQKTLNEELGRMLQVKFDESIGLGLKEQITQEQQALQSVDVNKLILDYKLFGKANKELAESYATTAASIGVLTGNKEFLDLAKTFQEQGDVTDESRKSLLNFSNTAIQAGVAISRLGELQKATNAAFQQAAPSGLQFASVATAVTAEIEALNRGIEAMEPKVAATKAAQEAALSNVDSGLSSKLEENQRALDQFKKDYDFAGREAKGGLEFDPESGELTKVKRKRSEGFIPIATEGVAKTKTIMTEYNDLIKERNNLLDQGAQTSEKAKELTEKLAEENEELTKGVNRRTLLLDIQRQIVGIQAKGLVNKSKETALEVKLENIKTNAALSEIDKEEQKLNIAQEKKVLAVQNAELQRDIAQLAFDTLETTEEAIRKRGEAASEEERAALAAYDLALEQLGLAEARRDVGEDILKVEKEILAIKNLQEIFDNGQLAVEARRLNLLVGATSVQKRNIDFEYKLVALEQQRAKLMFDLAREMKKAQTEDNSRRIAALYLQLDILGQQEAALLRQQDITQDTIDKMADAFQTSFQSGLADLIKGNESSFKDFALNLGLSVANAAADNLAKRMTDLLFKKKEESPEEKIKRGMQEAAMYHAEVIKAALAGDPIPGAPDVNAGTDQNPSDGQKSVKTFKNSWKEFTGSISAVFDKNTEGGFLQKLGTVFTSGGSLLQNLFGGLLGGLQSVFSQMFGGSGSLANTILSSAVSALFGSFGAGSTTSTSTSTPAPYQPVAPNGLVWTRYGGVIGESGKMLPGYKMGGIASGPQGGYPVMMHGTEAVVPLGNNRSIPVELSGAGQQNNVTVNVAIDNQGKSQEDTAADSTQGDRLGVAISAAVQKELLNQKRQGGILSRNGVA
jgi:hypothetical protein